MLLSKGHNCWQPSAYTQVKPPFTSRTLPPHTLTLSPTTGVVDTTYEILSLEMVRNALASLTQAGLIRQPSRCMAIRCHGNVRMYIFHVCVFICSEVEGRDRLVKVDKQEKLVQLAEELGEQCNTDMVQSYH